MTGRLLLAAAFVAAYAFYAHAWPVPIAEPDTAGYLTVAEDLRDLRLSRVYERPPGYPALLLAAGSSPEPSPSLVRIQLVLHFAAVAALASLLRRVGCGRAARAAFVAVALLPPFVEHAAFVLTESLTQLLLALGVTGVVLYLADARRTWLAVATLSLGCVGLVHPGQQAAPFVIGAGVLAASLRPAAAAGERRRAAAACAALVAGAALVTGAWAAHNALRFGYAGVSPMLGVALSHKTVRVWERIPDADADLREILIRHRDALLVERGADHLAYGSIYRALPELRAATGEDDVALGRRLVSLNLRLIRAAPLQYLDEVARSLVWFWSPGVSDAAAFGSPGVKALWHALRLGVLAAFGLAMVLLAGPALRYAVAPRGAADEAPDAPRLALFAIGLGCAVVAWSMLASSALTSAVWRLRVPVDLQILACAVLAPAVWRALARRMPLVPAPETPGPRA